MVRAFLRRALVAGAVTGLAFGAFVALVASPLVAATEAAAGHHEDATGGEHGGLLPSAASTAVDLGAGLVWGLLAGAVVFGLGYYFLEPAVPGAPDTRSYLLGAAGFLTASGVPWLFVPPQPPGVEAALGTEARLALYAAGMVAGATACLAAGVAFRRLSGRSRAVGVAGAVVPFAALGLAVTVLPVPAASTDLPASTVAAYRGVVVAGQAGFWFLLASVHAWLVRRDGPSVGLEDGPAYEEPSGPNAAD